MFRGLRHPVNREHDIGSLRIEVSKCKIPTDVSQGTRKYTFVNGRPGFNKKFISKSFRWDRAEQGYEYAFATGPEITYTPSNDVFLKSGTEEISKIQSSSRKIDSNDNLDRKSVV